MNFRMIRGDGVADLLEDSRFSRARRSDDDAARAFADGRDEVNHACLNQVRRGFELKFFDRVNAREVLEADNLRVILERHFVDFFHGLELRAGAAMRRLRGANDMAALAQKVAADGVGRDEDIGGLGVKMVGGGAQEAEALLGNLQVAGTVVGGFLPVAVWTAHIMCVYEGRNLSLNRCLELLNLGSSPEKRGPQNLRRTDNYAETPANATSI